MRMNSFCIRIKNKYLKFMIKLQLRVS